MFTGNIPEANYVSRKHCSIYEKNGVWYIKDLGSTNDVFVNRKKISDETQLNDGDEVALGNALFVFKIETEK
jgi:pSer/pThr/pTyr-binding forkhead associated (FHA) protein